MIPGFAIAYKDDEHNVHIYFYPGYDDQGEKIYGDIEWNTMLTYTETKKDDGAIDYMFEDKSIKSISLKLVDKKTKSSRRLNFLTQD